MRNPCHLPARWHCPAVPVWHEWHEGGFNVHLGGGGINARHLRRNPRASIVVYDDAPPYAGIELRGEPASLAKTSAQSFGAFPSGTLASRPEMPMQMLLPGKASSFALSRETSVSGTSATNTDSRTSDCQSRLAQERPRPSWATWIVLCTVRIFQ